jgi:hypothetical protein
MWRNGGNVPASVALGSLQPFGKEIAMSENRNDGSSVLHAKDDPKDPPPNPNITDPTQPPVPPEPPSKGD